VTEVTEKEVKEKENKEKEVKEREVAENRQQTESPSPKDFICN
jgi:hypothetical protein